MPDLVSAYLIRLNAKNFKGIDKMVIDLLLGSPNWEVIFCKKKLAADIYCGLTVAFQSVLQLVTDGV